MRYRFRRHTPPIPPSVIHPATTGLCNPDAAAARARIHPAGRMLFLKLYFIEQKKYVARPTI